MAGRQQDHGGGIRSLCELIDEHSEAVEFDLITHGLRLDWLGTERLSWRDLLVIVRQAPAGTALDRAMNPESAAWGLSEHLAANVFDALQVVIWQNGSGKKADFPKPFPRPGIEPPGKKYGKSAISIADMNKALGWDQPTEVPHE